MIGDAAENGAEVGLATEPVELGRFDQGINGRGAGGRRIKNITPCAVYCFPNVDIRITVKTTASIHGLPRMFALLCGLCGRLQRLGCTLYATTTESEKGGQARHRDERHMADLDGLDLAGLDQLVELGAAGPDRACSGVPARAEACRACS